MSAVLQLPLIWAASSAASLNAAPSPASGHAAMQPRLMATAVHHIQRRLPTVNAEQQDEQQTKQQPDAEPLADAAVTYAFYRKHTEKLLRRYLYASMQVGRSPNLLGESVGRGWVSSRRVRTFEDALIFVLDVERCLKRLTLFDRQIITRILIQEYTQAEAASILGISLRTVNTKLPQAIDRLTEHLVTADLLILPN